MPTAKEALLWDRTTRHPPMLMWQKFENGNDGIQCQKSEKDNFRYGFGVHMIVFKGGIISDRDFHVNCMVWKFVTGEDKIEASLDGKERGIDPGGQLCRSDHLTARWRVVKKEPIGKQWTYMSLNGRWAESRESERERGNVGLIPTVGKTAGADLASLTTRSEKIR